LEKFEIPRGVVMIPKVDSGYEVEKNNNYMKKLHRCIVMIILFPMVCGMPCGSS
jgi:hypothetical protein